MAGLMVRYQNKVLRQDKHGQWSLDGKPISEGAAILELVESVGDLDYWQKTAKKILLPEQLQAIQDAYEYEED
ncbi:MAG: hypothetical protein ACI35R_13225 [Bacillus sp. (in: firmicutes)]